mmetsp:Transcript_11307/g.21154  ORF Transcript_11307/g.21154 Transcript_11307/m.21154 type:complete len:1145 (+) Transcript_11307:1699-5133(+)
MIMVDAIIQLQSFYISPPLCSGRGIADDDGTADAETPHLLHHDKPYVGFSFKEDFLREICHLLSRMNVNCVADVIDYTAIDFHQDYSSGIVTQTMVSFSHDKTSSVHVHTPDASSDGFLSVDVLLRDCEWSLPGDDDEVTSHAMAYTLRSLVPVTPVRSLWQLDANDFHRDEKGNHLLLKDPLGVQFMMDTNSHELKLYSSSIGNRFLNSHEQSFHASPKMSWGDSIHSIQHDPVLIALLCLLAIMAVVFFDVMIFLMENPPPKIGTYPFLLGSMRSCVYFVWYSIKLYGEVGLSVLWSLVDGVMEFVTLVRLVVVYRSLCILDEIRLLPSVIWVKTNMLVSYSWNVILKFSFCREFGQKLLASATQSVLGFARFLRSSIYLVLSTPCLIISTFVFHVTKIADGVRTFIRKFFMSLSWRPSVCIVSKFFSLVTFPWRVFTKRSLRADPTTLQQSKHLMTPQCKGSTPTYCPSICPVTFYKSRPSNESTDSEQYHLECTTKRTMSPSGSLKGVALFHDDVDSCSPRDESYKTKISPSSICTDSFRDIRIEQLLLYESHLHNSAVDHLDHDDSDHIAFPQGSSRSFDGKEECNPIESESVIIENFQYDKVLDACEDSVKGDRDPCEPISKQNYDRVEFQEVGNHPPNDEFAFVECSDKNGDSHCEKNLELFNARVPSKVETNQSWNATMLSTCLHDDILDNETDVGETDKVTVCYPRNISKNVVEVEYSNSIQGTRDSFIDDETTKTPKEEKKLCSINLGERVAECTEMGPNIEVNSKETNILAIDGEDAFAKTIDLSIDSATSLDETVQELLSDNHEKSCSDKCRENDGTSCQEQDTKSDVSEHVPASAHDDGHHSVEDSDKHMKEEDDRRCIAVDDVGPVPSTSGFNNPLQTASNLQIISDAQDIRAANDITVNETIISHERSGNEVTFVSDRSNRTIVSINTSCKEVTSQVIKDINSTDNTAEKAKDSDCLLTTRFLSVQQELIAKLKQRGNYVDQMKLSPHTHRLSSERDLSPCSKLQKTWELSAEMKSKPKKLKTPDVFLSKTNQNKSVSLNFQTAKGCSKKNVSQLVAKWSKDAVSPSNGSEGATESKFRQTPVTNNFPSRSLRLSKSKKIQPSQTDNGSCDEKSTHLGEPLSFLNEMLG